METVHAGHAKVFKAFCDENRLRILEMLRGGEKCACILLEQLDIKQPALSYHMKILMESGVVESRQEGKWTHYRISDTGSACAMQMLLKITTSNGKEDQNTCCNP